MFYSVGLQYVLRGVAEHHDLKVNQIKRVLSDISVYSNDVYYEFIPKNNQHRFKDINGTNKSVRVYNAIGLVLRDVQFDYILDQNCLLTLLPSIPQTTGQNTYCW
ncbi:MAG: hypothetical protein K0U41_07905 [Gammaproteobacteria bacterium]|nr:hypothetical protein [Gammaproteobacteria bacterium]